MVINMNIYKDERQNLIIANNIKSSWYSISRIHSMTVISCRH